MLKDKRKRIWAWILAGVLLTESMHPSTANAAQIPKEILTDENTADTQQPKEKECGRGQHGRNGCKRKQYRGAKY